MNNIDIFYHPRINILPYDPGKSVGLGRYIPRRDHDVPYWGEIPPISHPDPRRGEVMPQTHYPHRDEDLPSTDYPFHRRGEVLPPTSYPFPAKEPSWHILYAARP